MSTLSLLSAAPSPVPTLSPDAVRAALSLRDLTDPAQGQHAMQTLLGDVVQAVSHAWEVPARIHRPGPVVAVEDNYDRLGFSAGDVTRDARYSRYLSPTVMLRSHTSAAVAPLLRTLGAAQDSDALHVMPGLSYRRDAIDRTHVGEPHQVDLWRVGCTERMGLPHLERLLELVVQAVLPGAQWRAVRSLHPYTTQGVQLDVRVGSEWLELAEAGLVAPGILAQAGLSPNAWSGVALGMGLDRALMLRKGIGDIRLLRSADPRVAAQLADLSPYREVSLLPSITRDLSVVVSAQEDEETLGDQVREALGEQAGELESVSLLASTPAQELPEGARRRLGLVPGQVNALLRMVIRPLSATLTDAEANVLRDRVYLAVHRGSHQELIAATSSPVR